MPLVDLPLNPGDVVEYGTVRSGLSGGSCRVVEKTVDRVEDSEDTVYFTDGSSYHYLRNPGMTLRLVRRSELYDVWMEGFRATGESATAQHIGSARGTTFEEACRTLLRAGHSLSEHYDSTRNSVWGCRLYPTEMEARRTFG